MQMKLQHREVDESRSAPDWGRDWRGIATVSALTIVAWLAVIGIAAVLDWLL